MRRSFGRVVRGLTIVSIVALAIGALPTAAQAEDAPVDPPPEVTVTDPPPEVTVTDPPLDEPPGPAAEETITVVPTVDTPEDDYGAGTDALVIGDGWGSGEEVTVVITGTDGVEYLRSYVIADADGHFELTFTLAPYYVPRYEVVADGSSGEATTSFTDVAVSLTNEATSAADLVFFPGETVRASVTAPSVTNWYKIKIVQPDAAQAYLSAGCLTPAQATTGETYTLASNAELSKDVQWTVTAVRYTDAACTLGQANVASALFAVTKVFAFANATARTDCIVAAPAYQPATTGATTGCSDALTSFAAGASVFVRVLGYPKTDDTSTKWRDPSNNLECANTSGTDRPESSSAGQLDLQYVPIAPEVTDAACAATTGADSGQWSLTLEPSLTPPGAASNQTYKPVFTVGNNPPVATDDDASGTEDTLVTIAKATLLGNDSDGGDGGALSLTAVNNATGGSVIIDGTNVKVTPTANLCGDNVATFEYTLSDTFGTDTGLVTIDLTCVNDPPVATDDDASGTEDTLVTIAKATLLGNDNNGGDGGALSVTAVANPTGGSVVIDGTNVKFTPAGNLCGLDAATFEYTVTDTIDTDTGLVTIDLTCVNDPPAATDDDASGTEDTLVTIAKAALLANDNDGGDGGALSLTAVANPTGGSVVIDGTNVKFTPTANLCGNNVATFEYTVSDTIDTDTGLVTIDLTCVQDPPVATDDDASGTEDTLLTIAKATLLGNDTDADLDTLTLTSVSSPAPAGSSVVIDGTNVKFTPTSNLCGTDVASFAYTVSDGTDTDIGVVTIDLTCVDDAPVLTLPATASGQYSDNLATVNISASDVDTLGADLDFTNSASACGVGAGLLPLSLSLTDNGNGTATITGQLTQKAGTYVACIVVSDATSSVTGTITITINKEDATVTFASGNPTALQVPTAGGSLPANALTLVISVKEKIPDLPAALALAGDIANAGLTVSLMPLATGPSYTLTCTSVVTGTGYAGVKTFTCKNGTAMVVNTYEISADLACIGGNCYYGGTGWDAFTVFDPTLGFTTGGGYVMRPTKNGPDEKENFGFTIKYNKSGSSVQGNLLVIRHHANGTVSRLKSNSLGALVLTGVGCGVATFNGKATFSTWDPTLNGGLGAYVSSGNNTFSVYAEDCNNPGTGLDYFWVFGPAPVNMQTPNGSPSVDKLPLTGGNIQVPHRLR